MTDPARPVQAMLEEEDLKDAILLVFANKQDMKGACDPASCGRAVVVDTGDAGRWDVVIYDGTPSGLR
jgi:ADP-ribosylation factor-like protein 1